MLFSHKFLIAQEFPSHLLGRDTLSKVQASFFFFFFFLINMEHTFFIKKKNVYPRVWPDRKTAGQAPATIKLKDTHLFPHQKQYPLKPEVKEELKLITENLKEQGL